MRADLNLNHNFAVVPEVLPEDEWVKKYGNRQRVVDLQATPAAAPPLDESPSDEPPDKLN